MSQVQFSEQVTAYEGIPPDVVSPLRNDVPWEEQLARLEAGNRAYEERNRQFWERVQYIEAGQKRHRKKR
jgi:hypothetical protein